MLDQVYIDSLLERALMEDIDTGDITSEAIIPTGCRAQAVILAKATGILAGLPVACRAFQLLDSNVELKALASDGDRIIPGQEILRISGNARAVLSAERTALNFLQQLSGVATRTARFVELVHGTQARIVDTRKTVPGLRVLQKYAVRMGGGTNHRIGLYDAVLIKDNHIKCAGGVGEAVRAAKAHAPAGMKIEVETETLEQVQEALNAGADAILLDNMSPAMLKEAVVLIDGRALTEASGNVSEETVTEIARTGVDWISVGKLTHTITALDLSLEVEVIL